MKAIKKVTPVSYIKHENYFKTKKFVESFGDVWSDNIVGDEKSGISVITMETRNVRLTDGYILIRKSPGNYEVMQPEAFFDQYEEIK